MHTNKGAAKIIAQIPNKIALTISHSLTGLSQSDSLSVETTTATLIIYLNFTPMKQGTIQAMALNMYTRLTFPSIKGLRKAIMLYSSAIY